MKKYTLILFILVISGTSILTCDKFKEKDYLILYEQYLEIAQLEDSQYSRQSFFHLMSTDTLPKKLEEVILNEDTSQLKFMQENLDKIIDLSTTKTNSSFIAQCDSIPWAVQIFSIDGNDENFEGSGSIISDQWIVTAAHVVPTTRNYAVYVGSHLDRKGMRYVIRKENIHPSKSPMPYKEEWLENDIALMKLDEQLQFTNCLKNVSYRSCEDLDDQSSVYIAGWGFDEYYYTPIPTKELRNARIPVQDQLLCRITYDSLCQSSSEEKCVEVNDKKFCAGTKLLVPCVHDSGGPAYINLGDENILVGIISYSRGCQTTDPNYAIFTNLCKYKDWIDNTTTPEIAEFTISALDRDGPTASD